MNTKKHRASIWNSFLSVLVLGVFIVVAIGSFGVIDIPLSETKYLGEGVYSQTLWYDWGGMDKEVTYTGKKDKEGRWHGPVKILTDDDNGDVMDVEEVEMVNGMRHGRSKNTTTYYSDPLRESVSYYCYDMGHRVNCGKSAFINSSAFKILRYKYPWFVNSLNSLGYDDVYVEAYMDSLESFLDPWEFSPGSFDSYYEFGTEELEDTPYDSIIFSNFMLSSLRGKEILKNNELRLAILDRYRSNGQSTKDIVNTTYTHLIDSWYFEHEHFEAFCDDLDSCMDSYGPLDLEDPFFIDSVDIRFGRSLWGIIEYKEDTTATLKSAKTVTLRELKYRIHDALIAPTTISVAIQVWLFLEREADQGDIIKRAVLESFSMKRAWVQIPTATTELLFRNSASSVTLQGLVLENGGAEVTSRGIALATYYNPTIYDQAESSGSGTGEFAVEVNGLTEGTYYARTYATNSTGTAYGNCISFTGSGTTGLEEIRASDIDLKIYPNPTSGIASLSFHLESSKAVVLNIIDMKGRVVDHRDLGVLLQGENMVQLDLSSQPGGFYHLQLSNHGTKITTRKLLIVH